MRISDWSSDVCSSDLCIGIMFLIGAGACEKKEQHLTGTREGDEEKLRELREKIDSLSRMYPCSDAADWQFTAIGAKACGGPTGYVPYSTELDTGAFLRMVETYTALQDAYNREYGIALDCAYVRSEEHTTELQSLMRISYTVFCLKKK